MSASPQVGHYLALAALLFGIGAVGALVRRNGLVLVMCVELMLNAGNLVILTYSRFFGDPGGHAVAFFVMALAAAEAAVGLAILLGAFRLRQTIDVDEFDSLRDLR